MNLASRADGSGRLIKDAGRQKGEPYMGEEFLVSTGYQGYVLVGWAAGRFQNDQGQMTPYANMFVLSPVSKYESAATKQLG